jgi:hypothetical protein
MRIPWCLIATIPISLSLNSFGKLRWAAYGTVPYTLESSGKTLIDSHVNGGATKQQQSRAQEGQPAEAEKK